MSRRSPLVVLAMWTMGLSWALGGEASEPLGEPVLERPTLRSLGAYWIIRGDDNRNATVTLAYRKAGGPWQDAPALLRVSRGAHEPKERAGLLKVPADAWLFAGSALLLDPDSPYELKLTLFDPDGGQTIRTLSARTVAEPAAPAGPLYHVVPGAGGGAGTSADPYKGIAEAQKHARPGDTFLLHAGTYEGPVVFERSGEPGRPIVWRGQRDHSAILDGKGKQTQRIIDAGGQHDLWLEDLAICNGRYGIVSHEASRLVVRGCRVYGVDFGLCATRNDSDQVNDYFISDNVIEGPSTWPRSQGIEDARGIQLAGAGHVVCYNRVRGFADAIDTFQNSPRCEAIDFHNNDVSELTDDGFELDYGQRNVRCFENRLTNVYQGISAQPAYGGPIYIFRNAMYNVCVEPFKLHNGPSGVLVVHNTVVKKGMPASLYSSAPVSNCMSRNNLFIGTADRYAFESLTPMVDCDFDYDGFGGGPFTMFLKWNGIKYGSIEEVRAKAPVYAHTVRIDPATAFASGVLPPADENRQAATPDLRLSQSSAAVDAGQVLPGFNDGFAGKGPDLGAYELGASLPHYGPRASWSSTNDQ